VRALTGVDADRLPEEKRRGITIDIGFAELDLGDVRVGFVDVPGHEKFVKNMLAGAHGIDLVALVVAADEGVMPQTREHFDICRLLEVKSGLVVITKSDMVDAELLEVVKLDAAELVQNSFLANAPVAVVSAKTGDGIDSLKQTLKEIALKIPVRSDENIARLPIDRAFSVKGFGAVVTGTLIAGEIRETDEMELLPPAKKVRVRGVQTHGKSVATARAGQRTAVNLGGIDHAEIERGMVLAPVSSLHPTQILDVEIEVLPHAPRSIRSRQRVRVHIGTVEALARVQILEDAGEIAAGERGLAQVRLEMPVVTVPGERFIIRSYSPQTTIAGGRIINALAAKHRRRDFANTRVHLGKHLEAAAKKDRAAELKLFLESAGEQGLTKSDLTARTGWREATLQALLETLVGKKAVISAENRFISRTVFDRLAEKTVAAVQAHHRREPLSRGIQRETLREQLFAHLPAEIFRAILSELEKRGQIELEKDVARSTLFNRALAPADKTLLERLQNIYRQAALEVPALETALAEAAAGTKATKEHARKIFQLLLDGGELVRVSAEFYFSAAELENLVKKMRDFSAATPNGAIDVAQFKDLANVSRKYAIPLLEYFDQTNITRRVGDKRLVLPEDSARLVK
jgi:selenocysteine-specific elongation factor